jgi:predicted Zn-dependent protease
MNHSKLLARMRRQLTAALVAALLSGVALAQSPAPATPASPPVDPVLLQKASDLAYSREVARARKAGTMGADPSQLSYLRRIAAPIIAYADQINRDAKAWHWSINIETRDELVAWSLPGGHLMVSTPLLDRGRFSAAEIAALMAHAFGHALLGHDAAEAAVRLAAHPDAGNADPNRRLLALAEILTNLATRDVYQPDHERAADAVALELLARGGYDPNALASLWRKLAGGGPARIPAFVALHQDWPERSAEIEARLPAALALYPKALREREARPAPAPRVIR